MKTIINNIIFNNKDALELEHEYIYNQYNEKESIQADTQISNTSESNFIEFDSYISLRIKGNADYIYNGSNSLINYRKIDELDSYTNLPFDLEKLFLIPETSNSKMSYLTFDINYKDLFRYYDYNNNNSDLIESVNKTRKISIDDSFLDNYKIFNKKSSFYSSKDDDVLENYNLIFEENDAFVDYNIELNQGKFLGEYHVYNKRIADKITEPSESNYLERFVGFYLVKYRKSGIDFQTSNYTKVATKFIKSSILSRGGSIQQINDEFVKYNQTYKYYIYPVYSLSIYSYDDNFSRDQIFVCGYPLITKDIVTIETKRPDPPNGPFFKIDKNTLNLEVLWKKPFEKQNDIKGFQVFKRNNLDQPFTLIAEYRSHFQTDFPIFNDNINQDIIELTPGILKESYIDKKFDTSKVNIYSICSIDAHGQVSDLSTQVGVVYDVILQKITTDLISESGAPREYPNLYIKRQTKYFDNNDSIITNIPLSTKKNKFSLYFTPDCQEVFSEYDDIIQENNVFDSNSEFRLNIFRVNGQKNIFIKENNEEIVPKIKIEITDW